MNRLADLREKWQAYLRGEDVGPMVSPLCDDWSLDVPYYWPLDEEEVFPAGHRSHALTQQIAMAAVCGWDPTYLAGVDFTVPGYSPRHNTTAIPGGTRTEATIDTPYGELKAITDQKTTMHTVKEWIETREDLQRMVWHARRLLDYDENIAVEQGLQLRKAVGEKGVLGTWFGPPVALNLNREMMFYHIADWPDEFEELHQATRELQLRQVDTLHKAGFDFLFYCVEGTEWISPDFFRRYILDSTREIFERWRAMGGFILWHSCGHIKALIEAGFYNDLKPEIFETMSEPPVGNLPGLKWARERLDPAIATKGNLPLNILLNGTPEEVREDVCRIKRETAGYRHIIGLSDDLLKNTPLANAHAFVDEARRQS